MEIKLVEQHEKYLSFMEALKLLAPERENPIPSGHIFEIEGEDKFRKIPGCPESSFYEREEGRTEFASDVLITAMQKGLIRSYGSTSGDMDEPYGLIAPSYFIDAEGEKSDFGTVNFFDGQQEYLDVHIRSEDLIKLFGWLIDDEEIQPDDKALENVATNNKAETECRKWFEEIVKQRVIKKKNQMWYEAKAKFPALSYRGFTRVWAIHAPNEWKAAGRRKEFNNRDKDCA